MKKCILTACIMLASTIMVFAQKASDDFTGNWKTPQGRIISINITYAQVFSGVTKDKKVTVLKDVKFADGKWNGTLLKPDDGSTYNCELLLLGDKIRIRVKKGFLSKEIVWTKEQNK